jgi:redox-sensitive bicupin YhaK (pirin superfamily)
MSDKIELIVDPRASDLGDGFMVRRALPYQKKRMVGPFIFLDHMGPAVFSKEHPLLVRAHPHIGLSTLTFLFKGEMLHRDTLNNELVIRPGEVNWMTAGRGIAHSERSYLSNESMDLEGIQLWIALPKASEEVAPSFVHVDTKDIPVIESGRNKLTLIAGSAFGKTSPVPVYSPLFYLEGKYQDQERFELKVNADSEGAIYVAKGEIKVDDQIITAHQLVCFKPGVALEFEAVGDAHVMILGGEIFPEKRFIFWNFVSSSEARIEEAKNDWHHQRFGQVINETEFIPLPGGRPPGTIL